MACGRLAQPSRCSPSAMAPLEISTQRLPSARSSAICAAQRAIACASRPRPSLVTSEEPTLTTSVVAAATMLGCTAGFLLFGSGKKFVDAGAQRLATLAVDRRNLEPGSLPAQGADDAARARVGVRGVGHEVGLVENEPARLFVERGIVFLQLERERARVPGRIGVRLERQI